MSQQQKVMIVVGIFAVAFIGLVSSQSINMNQCSDSVQKAVEKFRKGLTSSVSSFSSSVTSSGLNSVQSDQLNAQLTSLTNSFSSLYDVSNGIDFSKFMTNVNELTNSYMAIGRIIVNPQAPLSMYRSYMTFLSDMMKLNTQLMSDIPQNCVPQYKLLVPQ